MARKTNKRTVKRGKVARKTMKRSKGSKVSRKRSKGRKVARKTAKRSKSKAKKVANILTSTYGLGNLYKVNEKRYKGQRVNKKAWKKKKKKKAKTLTISSFAPWPSVPSKKKKKTKTLTLPSRQSSMNSFLDGIESKSSKKGSWIDHVKDVWKEGLKSEPGYKYKDAMKDAKKTW